MSENNIKTKIEKRNQRLDDVIDSFMDMTGILKRTMLDNFLRSYEFEKKSRKFSVSHIYEISVYRTVAKNYSYSEFQDDPLDRFFIEFDKIIDGTSDISEKGAKISNRIKNSKSEISNFLKQISEENREELKILFSHPIFQEYVDEGSYGLCSKLVINPIVSMITILEKGSSCSIY